MPVFYDPKAGYGPTKPKYKPPVTKIIDREGKAVYTAPPKKLQSKAIGHGHLGSASSSSYIDALRARGRAQYEAAKRR